MNIRKEAELVASILAAASPAMPEPFATIARIAAASIASAAVALDAGVSEADVVAHIHRVRHIDTTAEDALVDAQATG